MNENLRKHLDALDTDPSNDDAFTGLEDVLTGDDDAVMDPETLVELETRRKHMAERGEWDAVARLLEFELLIAGEKGDEKNEVETTFELGQTYLLRLHNQREGLSFLEKVLALSPEHVEAQHLRDDVVAIRDKWNDFVERFRDEATQATEPSLRTLLFYRAAEALYRNDPSATDEVLQLVKLSLEADPRNQQSIDLLTIIRKKAGQWAEIAEAHFNASQASSSKDERLRYLKSAARLYAFKGNDPETAADLFRQVLEAVPGHHGAMVYLANYYEKKEEWDELVALYEDALKGRPRGEEELAMLLQIGMVHWKMRGDLVSAEEYFGRLRKTNPTHAGMLNFYREYSAKGGDTTKLVQVLSDAQRAVKDQPEKIALSRELALAAEGSTELLPRAIEAWKQILRLDKDDSQAQAALRRLYETAGQWNALLDLLKGTMDALPEADVPARVNVLLEMVAIYRDKLSHDPMVINTYNAILKIDPDNRAALDDLTRVYESLQRWPDLTRILERRAELETDPRRKTELLTRVATLWIERFNNLNKAVVPLQQVLALDPESSEALAQLKAIYTKRRAWKQLYEILQKEVGMLEGADQIERLAELAKLAAERLDQQTEAIAVWERVFEADPDYPGVLDELERLTERQKDWGGLARVLERRLHGAAESDLVTLLIKLGTVYADRLQDHARSAEKWRRVLELQPGHSKAVRVLKDAYLQTKDFDALQSLYENLGEWEALVDVLSGAADQETDRDLKIALSFRAAGIFEEKIGQPVRAQRSYERVLSVDETNARAARALLGIYREGGHWARLLGVYKVIIQHVEENSEEQLEVLVKLRDLCTEKLGDRAAAFQWAARAYDLRPERADLREALEAQAGEADAWESLLEIYQKRAGVPATGDDERLELLRRMARINADRLGRPDDAIESFRAVLALRPGDEEALTHLETIYAAAAMYQELIGVYETRLSLARTDEQRCGLLRDMAKIREEGLEDLEAAATTFRRVLELKPDDSEALTALEQMAIHAERWGELVEILTTRRSFATGQDAAGITFQLADLYAQKLGQPDKAIDELSSVLRDNPGLEVALDALEPFLDTEDLRGRTARLMEPHLERNEDYPRLARALTIILEGETDPVVRVGLLKRLATIQQDQLDLPRDAMKSLGAALALAPGDRALWDTLDPLAETTDQNAALAEMLTTAYRSDALDSASKTELAARIADIYDIRLGELEKSREFHEHVLDADPSAQRAFEALENLFNTTERWDEILDLYRRQGDRLAEPQHKRDLLLKMCFIFETVLERKDEAIRWYVQVLEIDPGDEIASTALENLYTQTERWRELADLLVAKLSRSEADAALDLHYRLGEIFETHLDDLATALDHYSEVLHRLPSHGGAQQALERILEDPSLRQRAAAILEPIYDSQGASAELVRVLEVQLEEVGEALSRVQLLSRIGSLLETKLSKPIEAFDAYARAFEADPTSSTPRDELRRLAGEQELFDKYCAVLEKGITNASGDAPLRADLLQEVAALYEVRLDDAARAEDAYHRLLEADSTDPETALLAARALESLYLLAGNWPKLVEILRLRVQLSQEPGERRELLGRVAEIQEAELDRPQDAVETYRELLDLIPDDLPALNHLERLFQRTERWSDLVGILRRKIELSAEVVEKLSLHFQIADLYEEKLDSVEDAIFVYHTILTDLGPDRRATRALVRLYQRSERWPDLLEALETDYRLCETSQEKADLLCLMGTLHRDKLDEPGRAVDRFRVVMELDSTHAEARSALEALLHVDEVKLEAAQVLAPLYDMENEWEKLIGVLELQAAEAMTPAERWEKLHEAADVAEVGLEDPARAFTLLGSALHDAAGEPHASEVVENLERLSAAINRHEELVGIYKDVVLDILDGALQQRVMLFVASTAHQKLGDLALAKKYYVKVLENFGDHGPSMDALEEIYRATEAYTDLREIYQRKINLATSDEERHRLLFLQARLCEEQLSDLPESMRAYESILDMGEDRTAIESLERLYAQTNRFQDLADLLNRQLSSASTSECVQLHYRLGELCRTKLEEQDTAIDHYRTALEGDSRHSPTINALETLMDDPDRRGIAAEMLHTYYKAEMDWPKLVNAIEARLENTPEPLERKALLLEMGTIYEEQLDNLEKAFETFSRMFREDIEDPRTRDLLSRLANNLDCWSQLADVYAGALADAYADTEGTVELALVLGEIYDVHCDAYEKSREAYLRVLAFDPDRDEAFKALEGLFQRTAAWRDLLSLYRDAADRATDGDIKKDFLFKMADTQEGMLEDRGAAIEIYTEVLDIDEQDERAIAALDRLYYYEKRWTDLADLFLRRIEQSTDARTRHELRCQLGAICEERLQDLDAAIDHYEAVLESDPDHIDALGALERLIANDDHRFRIAKVLEPIYERKNNWQKLVSVYSAELDYISEKDERVRLRREIARLHESRGGDVKVAFDALAAAFEDDPNDDEILDGLRRLAEQRGSWDEFVNALEKGLHETYDTVRQAQILRLVAHTRDRRLGDPRAAIDAYSRLLEADESDEEALDALEGLYTLVSDWDGQIDTLERKANRAAAPDDRKLLFHRIGDIYLDMIGDSGKAIDAYRRAYLEDDTDLATIGALENLYEETEQWPDLIEVLGRRLDLESDVAARIEILHRRARVFEEKIGDEFEATTSYQAALSQSPKDAAALDALDRLHDAAKRWPDLLDVLRVKADLAADTAALVRIQLRIGALLETELVEPVQAIDTYRAVLDLAPDTEEAIVALERIAEDESHRFTTAEVLEPLLRKAGAWRRLVAVKELKLKAMIDPGERVLELRAITSIAEDGLRDPAAALDAHIRALGEDASDEETHDNLYRLAEQESAWEHLARAYEDRAGQIYDPEQVFILNMRLGRIYEERLFANNAAIEALRRALNAGLDDGQPLAALDRLYLREESWSELAEVLERELALTSDPSATDQLEFRLGSIREERFSDLDGAVSSYQAIVERNPDHQEAITALERLLRVEDMTADVIDVLDALYRRRGDDLKSAELYSIKVELAESPADKVALLCDLAVLQEQKVHDIDAAFASLSDAFKLEPGDDVLLSELQRLSNQLGTWPAFIGVLEEVLGDGELDPIRQREIGVLAARCYDERLYDKIRAEERYRKVLELEPENGDVLSALEALFRSVENFDSLVPVLRRRAEVEYDFENKKSLLREAAELARGELGNAGAAAECYRAILDIDESATFALDALAAIEEEGEQWEELAEILTQRARFSEDPSDGVRFRHQVATLYSGPLKQPGRAVETYREILDIDPGDRAALGSLELLLTEQERWADLQDVLMRRLDNAADDNERETIYLKQADLAEHQFSDAADAIDAYQAVLSINPSNTRATEGMERLLAQAERWNDLVEHLERRTAIAADTGDTTRELDLLVRIGDIWELNLHDQTAAIEIYEKVLDRVPDHTRALGALARLHEQTGDWDRCAEVLKQAASSGGAPQDVAEMWFRLGKLNQDQRSDEQGAMDCYWKAVELDPTHLDAASTLRALLETRGEVARVADLLRSQITATADRGLKVALQRDVGEIYLRKLGDAERAVPFLEQAREAEPHNKDVLLMLADVYLGAARQADAIPVLRGLIEAETESRKTGRSKELAVVHHRLGQALEASGDRAGARAEYEAAYKIDLSNVDVLASLGSLYYEEKEFEQATKVFRSLLLQRTESPVWSKADIYYKLGDIFMQQGDPRRALNMFQRGLEADKNHTDCARMIEELKSK